MGRVEEGNTVTDYDPDEIKRRISVSLGLAPIEWRDTKINVLDAPGYADFIGDVKSALRVADAAIILVDASAGVEVGTEQAWRLAEERGIPRLIFVNKMDRENADFAQAVTSIRSAFGNSAAPVQFPIGAEKQFRGVVDLLTEEAYVYDANGSGAFTTETIPQELKDDEETFRRQLIESIAEQDEELMMRYLEDETISTEELATGLTAMRCQRSGGADSRRVGNHEPGIPQLLDAIVEFVPPASATAERGIRNGDDGRCHRRSGWSAGGPGVQDSGRPACRSGLLLPRLLGVAQVECPCLELDPGRRRAAWTTLLCSRQGAHQRRRDRRRRHWRRRQARL